MKQVLMLLFISVSFLLVKGQVNEYFIPSNDYFNQIFLFETEKWENENGQFQKKNKIKYYNDPSGNLKKHIESTSYRYDSPTMALKVHHFFNVSESKVVDIYFYIEGISEELKQKGYINGNRNNKVILKYPNSNWTDKSDSEVTDYYKSEFGDLETSYGKYPNCIIVTKSSKSNTGKEKWVEKFVTKSYYAKNIGLIKTENYENGKLLKMGVGYGGTLVDDFSNYSFYQQQKMKNEELEKDKKKNEEERNIKSFLEERKNKIFDYKNLNYSDFNSINSIISTEIKEKLTNKNVLGTAVFSVVYNIDTLGQTSVSLIDNNSSNLEILNLIKPAINEIVLKPVYMDGYSVFAKAKYDFNILIDDKIFNLKKNNIEVIHYNNPSNLYEKEISNLISSEPIGKYTIQIQKQTINNEDFSKNSIIQYKSIGGPSNMFLSLLVPGLGDKNVTGGKKSGLRTACWSYGFILSGIGCKVWSNSEYNQYQLAKEQTSIDSHYDLANTLNKSFYILTATGALIWLYDIIWVANKGFQNKKNQKTFKQNLSLYYEQKNQAPALSYTLNF